MVRQLLIIVGTVVAVLLVSAQARGQRLGRPTVSPYNNLVTADILGQLGNAGGYQTLVKPFVDQRRAINANAADVNRLQNQSAYGSAYGSAGGRPAGGGGGRFMNFSHYYPGRATDRALRLRR